MSTIASSHTLSFNSRRSASSSSSPRRLKLRRLKRRAPPLQIRVGNEKQRRPSATVIVTVNAVAKRKTADRKINHLTLCMSKKNNLQSLTIQTNKAIKMRLIAISSEPMMRRMAATVKGLRESSERSEIVARLWLKLMLYLTTLMRISAKWYNLSARVAARIKEPPLNLINSLMNQRPPPKTYNHQLKRRRYRETRVVAKVTGTLLISRTLNSIKMLALVARRATMMRIARVAVPLRAVRVARRTWRSQWLS